jgi:hypothetical protein
MSNPELKKAELEERAFISSEAVLNKRLWAMDPPPWLKISDSIRINIYKEQLRFRIKELDIQMQQLKNEMDMVNASLKMLG